MLSDGWIEVILHEFHQEGMNLTDILYAEWEEVKRNVELDQCIRTTTPKTLLKWLGFKQRRSIIFEPPPLEYVVKLQFNYTSLVVLTVPETVIQHKSKHSYSTIFFNIVEEKINTLEGDQQIEVLWNHIKVELKTHYTTICKEREKHLQELRKTPRLIEKEEDDVQESPVSHEKSSEAE
jgi:hypothetical protein